MSTMRGGPVDGYTPPPEHDVPDDWSFLGTDGRVHRYTRRPDGDWAYEGGEEAPVPEIALIESEAPFAPDPSNVPITDAPAPGPSPTAEQDGGSVAFAEAERAE